MNALSSCALPAAGRRKQLRNAPTCCNAGRAPARAAALPPQLLQQQQSSAYSRRVLLGGALGSGALLTAGSPALAVQARTRPRSRRAAPRGSPADAAPDALTAALQGLTPGRIPGLSRPDADGIRTYRRPEGKSGGHGVGWSEIPPYSFRVPEGWDEIPVSIADLGGTELDLRFQSADDGEIAVVVAPVLRFRDVGFNADVRVEDLVAPDALISGFAPELIGKPLEEGDLLSMEKVKKGDLTYYEYELKPRHLLVSATAFKNRLFIFTLSSTPRQWRRSEAANRAIWKTFQVFTSS